MSIAIFAIFVGLVAVVGGLFIEYTKTKATLHDQAQTTDRDLENVLQELSSLKKRVQNLEAIAASTDDTDSVPLLDREQVIDEIVVENMNKVKRKAASK